MICFIIDHIIYNSSTVSVIAFCFSCMLLDRLLHTIELDMLFLICKLLESNICVHSVLLGTGIADHTVLYFFMNPCRLRTPLTPCSVLWLGLPWRRCCCYATASSHSSTPSFTTPTCRGTPWLGPCSLSEIQFRVSAHSHFSFLFCFENHSSRYDDKTF